MLQIIRSWRRSGWELGVDGKTLSHHVVGYAWGVTVDRQPESMSYAEELMYANQSAAAAGLIYPKLFDSSAEEEARQAAVALMTIHPRHRKHILDFD